MKLIISEIFESLQGESSFTGFPFFFIRLAGCNLRCRYCDTKYAYDNGRECSVEELVKTVKKSWIKRVLITGGEPLIQENVYYLIEKLLINKFKVFVETNGSVLLDKIPLKVVKIVDIKTPSSGMSKYNNYYNLDYINKRDEIKFVIGNLDDFLWAVDKIKRFKMNKLTDNILFSPVYGGMEPQELAELILKYKLNVRFQIQLHKILNLK
jgi:7-carboxy-7-deazaguanine synthase